MAIMICRSKHRFDFAKKIGEAKMYSFPLSTTLTDLHLKSLMRTSIKKVFIPTKNLVHRVLVSVLDKHPLSCLQLIAFTLEMGCTLFRYLYLAAYVR